MHLRYLGFVVPGDPALYVAPDFTAVRTGAEEDPDGEYQGSIKDGRVEVTVEVERDYPGLLEKHFFPALTFARTLVHVRGFATGIAYVVHLNQAVDAAGEGRPMIVADRRLGALSTLEADGLQDAVTELALTDLGVSELLSDASLMLTIPNYAPIAGGRIADSIARMISGGRGPAAWARMRDVLNISRDYLELLTSHSKAPRHGERLYVPGPVVHEIAERSWTLIDRYIRFRLSSPGCSPPVFTRLE